MNVAIITARGGSKRIPHKNIRNFAGKPMLEWPIRAARISGLFERIMVSTDSEEIAQTARKAGAWVPFMRPSYLADDLTPTAPVLTHALKTIIEMGINPDKICCIYPTSPFLLPEDLINGFAELEKWKAPGAISVTTFDFPILRAFAVCKDGSVAFNWPEYEMTRSQDLPEFLHDAGQFYWLDAKLFLQCERLIMPGTRPVMLPSKRVRDLDTPEDWEVAELMAKTLLQEEIDG